MALIFTTSTIVTIQPTQKAVFITSGTTYSIPSDFDSLVSIEAIGAGGGGGSGTSVNQFGGGGGGAYAKITALSGLAAGGSANVSIGVGGAGQTAAGVTAIDGGNTWFSLISGQPTTVSEGVKAAGGGHGDAVAAGSGGTTGNSIGTVKNAGGSAAVPTDGGFGGTGAGGAGGPHGTGANSVVDSGNPGTEGGATGGGASDGGSAGVTNADPSGGAGGAAFDLTAGGTAGTGAITPTAGGPGSRGSGGGGGGAHITSGTTAGGAGGNGGAGIGYIQTLDSAIAGPGGGGGGGGGSKTGTTTGGNGGSGGLYGGGGAASGCAVTRATGGAGANGIIIFTYVSVKTVFITSGTTFTIPSDFISLVSIECIGAGAGGSTGGTTGSICAAGGGGAYAKITALTGLTAGGSANISIGAGGAGAVSTVRTTGTSGTDTWFSIISGAPTTTAQGVLAKGGSSPTVAGDVPTPGGAGGLSATSIGTVKFAGGAGGNSENHSSGPGGGGAAGSHGAGARGGHDLVSADFGAAGGGAADSGSVGVDSIASNVGRAGGASFDATAGGIGGTATNIAGLPGSHGSGGGGAGQDLNGTTSGGAGGPGVGYLQSSDLVVSGPGGGGGGGGFINVSGTWVSSTPGAGGLYGGGGGGAGHFQQPAGAGANGIIIFKYTPWTPKQLTGLLAWYDASNSVYTDAGITLAANTQTVQQWNDLSGLNNHLSQATGASQPTFNTIGLNTKQALVFTSGATDDWMRKTSFNMGSASPLFSIFAVLRYSVSDTNGCLVSLWDTSGDDYNEIPSIRALGVWADTQGPMQTSWNNNAWDLTGSTSDNTPQRIGVIFNGTTLAGYTNNIAGTPQTAAVALAQTQQFTLCADRTATQGITCAISELVITSSALNSSERTALNNYFKVKWGSVLTDDFNAGSKAAYWTEYTQGGTFAYGQTVGSDVCMRMTTDGSADIWSGADTAPKLLQNVFDIDFDIRVHMPTTIPTAAINGGGLVVMGQSAGSPDPNNWIRFMKAYEGTFLQAVWIGHSPTNSTSWTSTTDKYLRMTRAGTTFTFYSSTDGSSWTQRGQITKTITVAYIGLHVIDSSGSAHTEDFNSFTTV